jgi:hypothetical protein
MTKAAQNTLPLPGLSENNPRDFLAAIGLLRLVTLLWPELTPLLSWDLDQKHPSLHTAAPMPAPWDHELIQALKSLAAHKDSPLFHGEVIRASPSVFDTALHRAISFARNSDHALRDLPALLYAAYSSQNLEDQEIHVAAFSFANGGGGKSLLRDVSQLIAALSPSDLLSALAGTAKPVSAKSLRWNPIEFRAAAFRGPDPGKGIKGDDTLDHPAFNVLAFVGLTFFPCVPSVPYGLTLGMHAKDRETYFVWPIWSHPISVDLVSSLLHHGPETLGKSHGIARRWQSRRFTADKSVYFSPSSAMA